MADQRLRERAAGAFGEQRVFAAQFHAAREAVLGLAIAADAHVARGDAGNGAVLVVEDFARGEAGIDLDAELGRLLAQPAAQRAEADDVIAVIVHQRRHQNVRQRKVAGGAQEQEAVLAHGCLDGRAFFLPVGDQAVQADGIDDGAGQDVRADLGALLQDDDRELLACRQRKLLQANGSRQPRGARANDHNVEFHGLPFGEIRTVQCHQVVLCPIPPIPIWSQFLRASSAESQ